MVQANDVPVGDFVGQLMGGNGPSKNVDDPRVQQSQLMFAALQLAQRGDCRCGPCQALRKSVDLLTAPVIREHGIGNDGNN
jgi:hypothetical protein